MFIKTISPQKFQELGAYGHCILELQPGINLCLDDAGATHIKLQSEIELQPPASSNARQRKFQMGTCVQCLPRPLRILPNFLIFRLKGKIKTSQGYL